VTLVLITFVLGVVATTTPSYFILVTETEKGTASALFYSDYIKAYLCPFKEDCTTWITDYKLYQLENVGRVISTSDSINKVACFFAGISLALNSFLILCFWGNHKINQKWIKWAKLLLVPALGVSIILFFLGWVLLFRLPSAFKDNTTGMCLGPISVYLGENTPCKSFSGDSVQESMTITWGPSSSFILEVVAFVLTLATCTGSVIIWKKSRVPKVEDEVINSLSDYTKM